MNCLTRHRLAPYGTRKWTTRCNDTYRLWPTDTRYRCTCGEHLTRSYRFGPPTSGRILGSHQKQCPSVSVSQHAGEAATIEIDGLQHLTTLTHAHTPPGADVRVPDGMFGIEANA